ncbi:MAG: hypothetical protein GF309_15870 [Candidatus Lokiarchaeota archaeon]|nr:hypothetical protein [Candidatus Lokiarchaeota archaeon]
MVRSESDYDSRPICSLVSFVIQLTPEMLIYRPMEDDELITIMYCKQSEIT